MCNSTPTNIIFKKVLITDFRASALELCSFVRTLMPNMRGLSPIQFVNIFLTCKDNNKFEYTFIFSSRWLNSRTLDKFGICPLNLYRSFSFLNNPTLWQ